MLQRFLHVSLLLVCTLAAAPALAQGVQSATISGTIRSADTLPLPGVTVLATSPELQGERVAVSDANGVYVLRGLPPGTYRVSFDLSAFQPSFREDVEVSAGAVATVDMVMALAGVSETVTVTPAARAATATPRTMQTYTKAEIDALILAYLHTFLYVPDLTIAARWHGVYAKHPAESCLVRQPAPGVTVTTGVGGAGMTLSFGLAEQAVCERIGQE